MNRKLSHSEVLDYLERYSTQEPPYDFNGLLHLVLAGVENLRKHHLEQELLDHARSITDDQARFLQRLLEIRPQSTAEFEKNAAHGSA